jgi:hypothetical protein
MIFVIPFLKLQAKVQKGVRPNAVIIPIGSDCHPAYFLKTLNVKKYKLPFDCMNIQPLKGLEFVKTNFLQEFANLTSGLISTGSKRFKSINFDYAEFFHEPDSLLERKGLLKLKSKIKQLLQLAKEKQCSFLYSFPGESLHSMSDVILLKQSVYSFISSIKTKDKLHIYIKWEEIPNENRLFFNALVDEFMNNHQVTITKFILQKKRYGIWGNQQSFYQLFEDLKLGKKHGVTLRISTKVKGLPGHPTIKNIKSALIQIEDRSFHSHFGISIKGICRAILMNIRAGKIVQGGSSLTQQLARSLMNDNSITFARKFKELWKAVQLEFLYDKNEILNLYLQNIYLGLDARGFYSASRFYFGKELEALRQVEYLILITILRSPKYYLGNTEKLKARFILINKILLKQQYISQVDYLMNTQDISVYGKNLAIEKRAKNIIFINQMQSC